MGGYSSGRHGGKRTTDDMHVLDIRHIQRAGRLTPGQSFSWQWSRRGEVVASINIRTDTDRVTLTYRSRSNGGEWQDMDCPVRLAWTECNYGGQRAWWLCPAVGCGRRVAVLYGGKVYACRHCHKLAYQSTRNSSESQAFARADKARKRLGWCAGIAHSPGGKPKGMHQKTFERWLLVYYALSNQAFGASSASLDKMMGRLKKIDRTADKYDT